MNDSNNRLVYSAGIRHIDEAKPAPMRPKDDGIVRIQRQTSGRKGRGICLISDINADGAVLNALAAELKKKCDCGGAVKDGAIEIQGDKRDLFKPPPEAREMRIKLIGG